MAANAVSCVIEGTLFLKITPIGAFTPALSPQAKILDVIFPV